MFEASPRSRSRSLVAPALALTLVAGALAPALADDEADCLGYGALSDNPSLALGHVGDGAPRTNFVRNSDAKGCPSDAASCRDKGYLVPGNPVIVGRTRGTFVCVDYIGSKGADRAGWLPAASVVRDGAPSVGQPDWLGTWTQIESTITIKRAKEAGDLAIHGDATFGALDPDRVKRGAVNVGEIEAKVAPRGADLAFAMGTDRTLPVDKGEDGDCKVWMRRLGPYLLVDDNNNCGGMNVSFRGAYMRRP